MNSPVLSYPGFNHAEDVEHNLVIHFTYAGC